MRSPGEDRQAAWPAGRRRLASSARRVAPVSIWCGVFPTALGQREPLWAARGTKAVNNGDSGSLRSWRPAARSSWRATRGRATRRIERQRVERAEVLWRCQVMHIEEAEPDIAKGLWPGQADDQAVVAYDLT